jgi:hypothetical protein
MKRMSASDIILLMLKILVILVLAVSLVLMIWLSYLHLDMNLNGEELDGLGYILGFLLLLLLNLGAFVLNAVAFLIAGLRKNGEKRGRHIMFHAVLAAIPASIQILYVLFPVVVNLIL